MRRYAEGTQVSSSKSKAEIEKTLERYGATKFFFGTEEGRAIIGFVAEGRQVRFVLPLPDRLDSRFTVTPRRNRRRTDEEASREWEKACRQSWRALALVVKAKLEAVESGITTFEEEFLAHLVLPGGKTVGAWMLPQVHRAYDTGKMPPMLPAGDA